MRRLLSQLGVLFTSDFLQPTLDILATGTQTLRRFSQHHNILKVSSDTLKTLNLHFSYPFTMSSTVLANKDVNAAAAQQPANQKGDVKSMEYHRQVLQSKLDEEQ